MKQIKNILMLPVLAGLCLFSCEKEEERVTLLGGSEPELAISSTSDLVLLKAQENFSSLQFQWTNPEYEFTNGVNTADVFYTLQIDTTGSNFSNPNMVEMSFTNDVNKSFLVKDLNNSLAVMELKDFVPHNFEFRVKSTLANGKVPLYSNVVPIKITTYLDVVYPVPTNLYITGAATPGNWMGAPSAELLSQKFTKVNSYLFVLESLAMNANSGYLFVPVYGNWDNKYGFTGAKEANNTLGDTFKPGGDDLKSPAVAKTYRITVNFKTGKFSLE